MRAMTDWKRLALIAALAAALGACGGDDGDDGARGARGAAGNGDTVIKLEQLGRYESGIFDEGAAEIVAFDASTDRLYVVNAEAASVDVLDIASPSNPVRVGRIDATAHGDGANSVAVSNNGTIAVAIESDPSTANGVVAFYDSSGTHLGNVTVGALPDMVTFTHDGTTVLVANEGEPSDDYSTDPEGNVSLIDISGGVASATASKIGFTAFNAGNARADELPSEVRIFGNCNATELTVNSFTDADPADVTVGDASAANPDQWATLASDEDPVSYQIASISDNTITFTDGFDGDTAVNDKLGPLYLHDGSCTVAQDLEPEYITVSADDSTAWVTLQENNALAKLDLTGASVDSLTALGTKNHDIPGHGLDASSADNRVDIRNWRVQGMYLPDAIASYEFNGDTFLVTANEGDAREYNAYVEEISFKDIAFEGTKPKAFNDETQLGGLDTSLANDTDGDGDLDLRQSFGARSFSIWNGETGELMFDSGDDFETRTAFRLGMDFNNDNTENDGDSRSDDKGPEPEAVATGTINGRTFAFVGLERVGGIMVYEVTNPEHPRFVQYLNNRNFDYNIEDKIDDGSDPAGAAGDLGPEGFRFIPASESPSGTPLLAVGNEVSGTTTLYGIDVLALPAN